MSCNRAQPPMPLPKQHISMMLKFKRRTHYPLINKDTVLRYRDNSCFANTLASSDPRSVPGDDVNWNAHGPTCAKSHARPCPSTLQQGSAREPHPTRVGTSRQKGMNYFGKICGSPACEYHRERNIYPDGKNHIL